MKLATYNILDGGTGRIDPLAEVLRAAQADIILLQECTDSDNFHKLADRLRMDRFRAENPRRGGVSGKKPAAVGVLTRFNIRHAENLALDPRLTRAALSATLDHDSQSVSVIALHFHSGETFADEGKRQAEWPAIQELAARLASKDSPLIIAGDFNASHPGQVIDLGKLRPQSRQRIARQNDHIPRALITAVLAAGYADTHALDRAPADFDTSMTTAHPAMRTDFIFVPQAFAPRVKSSIVLKTDMARFASDHYPAVAEIAS